MTNKILTKEEKACERHFELNIRRLETGRYEVRLPLSDSADKLGDSYNNAKKFLTQATTTQERLFRFSRRICSTRTHVTTM